MEEEVRNHDQTRRVAGKRVRLRLKELREKGGMTAQQLCDRAGCHAMTISKLERGAQEPAWPLVLALAKALGVEVTAFVVIEPIQAREEAQKPPGKAAGRPAGKRSAGKAAEGGPAKGKSRAGKQKGG